MAGTEGRTYTKKIVPSISTFPNVSWCKLRGPDTTFQNATLQALSQKGCLLCTLNKQNIESRIPCFSLCAEELEGPLEELGL